MRSPLLVAVLAAAYFDGWWLFAVAAVGAILALHELYGRSARCGRSCSPASPECCSGSSARSSADRSGSSRALSVFVFAFVLYGVAETRQSGTVTIATTVLGAFWIGAGIGHLILLREIGDDYLGRLSIFTLLLAVWAGDTAAYFAGRLFGRHKLAAVMSPGKTWEGFVVGSLATILVVFFALYQDREEFLEIWRRSSSAP